MTEGPPRAELPDAAARRATVLPPGLGRLGELAVWTAGVRGSAPPRPFARARLVALAADRPGASCIEEVRQLLANRHPLASLADFAGATVRVADLALDAEGDALIDLDATASQYRVRRGCGACDAEDALSEEEAALAVAAGRAIADDEIDAGADLLIVAGISTNALVPAEAIIGLFAVANAAEVTGPRTDDNLWMAACAAVRDAMRRGRPWLAQPTRLLAAIGGADLAATAGLLAQAASRRTPVLLDGVSTIAAALVADRMDFRARHWWLASHRGPEPAQTLGLARLSLDPVLDLGISAPGYGALAALPVLQAALHLAAPADAAP